MALPRVQFNPEINYGHLAMIFTLVVSGLVWGVRLENRVDFEAEARRGLEREWQRERERSDQEASRERARQTVDIAEVKNIIRDGLTEMRVQLRRLEDKVDQKADRPIGTPSVR